MRRYLVHDAEHCTGKWREVGTRQTVNGKRRMVRHYVCDRCNASHPTGGEYDREYQALCLVNRSIRKAEEESAAVAWMAHGMKLAIRAADGASLTTAELAEAAFDGLREGEFRLQYWPRMQVAPAPSEGTEDSCTSE